MSSPLNLRLLPNEHWWGGAVVDGHHMPLRAVAFERDLMDMGGNQAMPLLISNRGRSIWSEDPFHFRFGDATVVAESSQNCQSPIVIRDDANDLRGALLAAVANYFPPTG